MSLSPDSSLERRIREEPPQRPSIPERKISNRELFAELGAQNGDVMRIEWVDKGVPITSTGLTRFIKQNGVLFRVLVQGSQVDIVKITGAAILEKRNYREIDISLLGKFERESLIRDIIAREGIVVGDFVQIESDGHGGVPRFAKGVIINFAIGRGEAWGVNIEGVKDVVRFQHMFTIYKQPLPRK